MPSMIKVQAAWDDEAKVWFVEQSDVFGVNAEAATLQELRDKLPNVIADVLADNEPARLRHDLTVELIARSHTWIARQRSMKGFGQGRPRLAGKSQIANLSVMAKAITISGAAGRQSLDGARQIMSRHMANKILRDAGLPKAF